MNADELRESVVFCARFEFFDQMFRPPGVVEPVHGADYSRDEGLRSVPENWRAFPIKNAARVAEYWQRVLPSLWTGPPPPHWCACFAMWCLQEAGLTDARAELLPKPKNWLSFMSAMHLNPLPARALPKPGDVAYFEKNQHHAVVMAVDEKTKTFDSVDGNQPAILIHKGRALSGVKAFYSIQPLVDAKAT